MHASPTGAAIGYAALRLALIAGFCLVLGLASQRYLDHLANAPIDTAPPFRQGINAPFITTPDAIVDKMVELAELKDSDLVYDLGCGDGRIVVTAAMKSGCRGIGFDIDPERVAEATENAILHNVEGRVRIVEQDVFTIDLSEADVAMMYLLPWMMNKLLPQFQAMKDGCRIVAHDFWIDGVEPDRVFEVVDSDSRRTVSIYVYQTPLKLDSSLEKGKPPLPHSGRVERDASEPQASVQIRAGG